MSGARPSAAECRAALRRIVAVLAKPSPGDLAQRSAWEAIGAAQAVALMALGVPHEEWNQEIERCRQAQKEGKTT